MNVDVNVGSTSYSEELLNKTLVEPSAFGAKSNSVRRKTNFAKEIVLGHVGGGGHHNSFSSKGGGSR